MNTMKRTLSLGLALCMAIGVGLTLTACDKNDEPHTSHIDNNNDGKCDVCNDPMPSQGHTHNDNNKDGICDACGESLDGLEWYNISIGGSASALSQVDVMFRAADGSVAKKVDLDGTNASVRLAPAEYTVYLVGTLEGYIYAPVKVDSTKRTASINLESADLYGDGELAYQVLVTYPDGTPYKGHENSNRVQICTADGQEDVSYNCYDLIFNEYDIATPSFEILPAAIYDVHFAAMAPEGYTFNNSKYQISAKGGFITVAMEKA